MITRTIFTLALGILLVTTLCGPAQAGNKHHETNPSFTTGTPQRIMFGNADRQSIQEYQFKQFKKTCPHGLSKKNNNCMPPGQARKYQVGQYLPRDVDTKKIPPTLRRALDRPPHGYEYVMVDKDVLLIEEATKKVLDAVALVSAIRR